MIKNYNITQIDIDKLMDDISDNPTADYLIMSEETLSDIKSDPKALQPFKLGNDRTKTYQLFFGVPIAICNKLRYGEIEIL